MLSELEITQFEVFGFVVLRGFLSQQDVDSLNSEFDVALETGREHHGAGQLP